MGADPELEAMSGIANLLGGLDPEQRSRVLDWASDRYGLPRRTSPKPNAERFVAPARQSPASADFTEFAELFAAASPDTASDKALVAAYWLQVNQEQPNFQSEVLNAQLRDLGHYLGDIAHILVRLTKTKPQLLLQLRKAGSSQQARKTYKLSTAGIDAVRAMVSKSGQVNAG